MGGRACETHFYPFRSSVYESYHMMYSTATQRFQRRQRQWHGRPYDRRGSGRGYHSHPVTGRKRIHVVKQVESHEFIQ